MLEDLACLFDRDLQVLERELALYPDDETPWVLVPGIGNTGGNLALHLIGNLRHFIGNVLGHSGYVRVRELEFSTRSGTRASLLEAVQITREEVRKALATLDPQHLAEPFPEVVGPGRPITRRFLMHLLTHLGFHLGQIDYHRRILTGDGTSAGPTSTAALV